MVNIDKLKKFLLKIAECNTIDNGSDNYLWEQSEYREQIFIDQGFDHENPESIDIVIENLLSEE